jgi:hypothetical protein
MGNEARCAARIDGRRVEGKALLETDAIIFRGDVRLSIPRDAITAVNAVDGTLHIRYADGEVAFDLGPDAGTWAEKIRNPRSLVDKLGVKPGMRVAVLGVTDAPLLAQIAARTSAIVRRTPRTGTELIFLQADSLATLDRLAALRALIAPHGGIWVVHAKGKGAAVKDTDVMAAARRAGLVDVKVARVSETLTAEKLVIPLRERAGAS